MKSKFSITKKYLTNGQYLTERFEKTMIFLHFTAGGSKESSWEWWNSTPERIGTAYLVGRDGNTLEAFDPRMWASHLGVKGRNQLDKNSIGIELSNWGPLKQVNGKYFAYPGNYSRTEIPIEKVQIYDKPWRGFTAYEKFTENQIRGLVDLIVHLKTGAFPNLSTKVQDGFENYNGLLVSKNMKGIWSHSSVRKDKMDIHPQPNLLEALNTLSLIL